MILGCLQGSWLRGRTASESIRAGGRSLPRRLRLACPDPRHAPIEIRYGARPVLLGAKTSPPDRRRGTAPGLDDTGHGPPSRDGQAVAHSASRPARQSRRRAPALVLAEARGRPHGINGKHSPAPPPADLPYRPNSAVRPRRTVPPARRSHSWRAMVPTAASRRCLCHDCDRRLRSFRHLCRERHVSCRPADAPERDLLYRVVVRRGASVSGHDPGKEKPRDLRGFLRSG